MKTILTFLLFANAIVSAQWNSDPAVNNPVCISAGGQQNMQMVSDNVGGSILTWTDSRYGPTRDIYAQRIDANGNKLWNADGIAICNAIDEQFTPRIVSDGGTGAIITWYDNRIANNWDIYAQRINGNGIVQWTTDGVPICTATGNQNMQQLLNVGNDGAIIVWSDGRILGPFPDIYAQRVNGDGVVQWTANGVPICTASNSQGSPQLVTDGSLGAIVTWDDLRGTYSDIYAQRISATGVAMWANDGIPIATSVWDQDTPTIVSGINGAIISWNDYRNNNLDIYAQKIDYGTGTIQWASNGISVCSAPYMQVLSQMVQDNAGGAYFVWEDRRIYAQRVNNLGIPQWSINGVAVCTNDPAQKKPQLCLNNSGNPIITWQDDNTNIYAQGLTTTGSALWATNCVPVSTANGIQTNPQLVLSGGTNSMIIAWEDSRNDASDIYASKLFLNGTLPTPSFSDISTISIFPNPIKDILTIQNPLNISIEKMTITDLSGKKIMEQNGTTNQINVSKLSEGMYLLQITSEEKNSTTKFIKQ